MVKDQILKLICPFILFSSSLPLNFVSSSARIQTKKWNYSFKRILFTHKINKFDSLKLSHL